MKEKLFFRQLFDAESFTYSYLLADTESGEAVLIDPVIENVERDLRLVEQLDFKLKYVLDTHVHADHVTGAGKIRELSGAKTVVGAGAKVDCANVSIADDETLQFGSFTIKALATPGHTDGCTSYYIEGMVFTGDALLIRGNGRTDFQQGSSEKLFRSIVDKLYKLPKETKVYPAHDYRGQTASSIGEEMRFNARIPSDQTLAGFVKVMEALDLADPKKIKVSVPANMKCGQLQGA
ncbi:MAG: MBL fold metallo-hydrolase [Bdellovibrionales bacterium]|nr:MBL fold metallo-hydrolase [Bdellovibrionales bacterium]